MPGPTPSSIQGPILRESRCRPASGRNLAIADSASRPPIPGSRTARSAGAGPFERKPPRRRSPRRVHPPTGRLAESAGMVPTPKRSRSGSLSGIATGASTFITVSRRVCATSARVVLGKAQTGSKAAAAKTTNFILRVQSPRFAKILRSHRQKRLPCPLGPLRPVDEGSGIFMCS